MTDKQSWLWEFHTYNVYWDGTIYENSGIGFHINKWKIVKGSYITEMHEELFMFGFMIRPMQLITIRKN